MLGRAGLCAVAMLATRAGQLAYKEPASLNGRVTSSACACLPQMRSGHEFGSESALGAEVGGTAQMGQIAWSMAAV